MRPYLHGVGQARFVRAPARVGQVGFVRADCIPKWDCIRPRVFDRGHGVSLCKCSLWKTPASLSIRRASWDKIRAKSELDSRLLPTTCDGLNLPIENHCYNRPEL